MTVRQVVTNVHTAVAATAVADPRKAIGAANTRPYARAAHRRTAIAGDTDARHDGGTLRCCVAPSAPPLG